MLDLESAYPRTVSNEKLEGKPGFETNFHTCATSDKNLGVERLNTRPDGSMYKYSSTHLYTGTQFYLLPCVAEVSECA